MPDNDWKDTESDDDDEFDVDESETEETTPCPHCGEAIHEETERCPHCEHYLSTIDAPRKSVPWWLIVLIVMFILQQILR